MNVNLLDDQRRKRFALWGLVVNLIFLHAWATGLVLAGLFGKDNKTIQLMFDSVMTGIGISLLLLISDKAVDFVISRFVPGGAPQVAVTETVTRTVTPNPPPPAADTPAKDVTMNVEGDVNVRQSGS